VAALDSTECARFFSAICSGVYEHLIKSSIVLSARGLVKPKITASNNSIRWEYFNFLKNCEKFR